MERDRRHKRRIIVCQQHSPQAERIASDICTRGPGADPIMLRTGGFDDNAGREDGGTRGENSGTRREDCQTRICGGQDTIPCDKCRRRGRGGQRALRQGEFTTTNNLRTDAAEILRTRWHRVRDPDRGHRCSLDLCDETTFEHAGRSSKPERDTNLAEPKHGRSVMERPKRSRPLQGLLPR